VCSVHLPAALWLKERIELYHLRLELYILCGKYTRC
jgi:hypothetical protein